MPGSVEAPTSCRALPSISSACAEAGIVGYESIAPSPNAGGRQRLPFEVLSCKESGRLERSRMSW